MQRTCITGHHDSDRNLGGFAKYRLAACSKPLGGETEAVYIGAHTSHELENRPSKDGHPASVAARYSQIVVSSSSGRVSSVVGIVEAVKAPRSERNRT